MEYMTEVTHCSLADMRLKIVGGMNLLHWKL